MVANLEGILIPVIAIVSIPFWTSEQYLKGSILVLKCCNYPTWIVFGVMARFGFDEIGKAFFHALFLKEPVKGVDKSNRTRQ